MGSFARPRPALREILAEKNSTAATSFVALALIQDFP
jgi:hypothetical protein